MMDVELQKDITKAIFKLRGAGKAAKAASIQSLRKAAAPLVEEIQFRAPVSEETHYRYSSGNKLVGSIRAPKGFGNIVATYTPGNLERSFQIFKFRRSSAIFVGPKGARGAGGVFSGQKTDGFYGFWQEFGAPKAGIVPRPFVKPAFEAAKAQMGSIAINELTKAIQKYVREVAV